MGNSEHLVDEPAGKESNDLPPPGRFIKATAKGFAPLGLFHGRRKRREESVAPQRRCSTRGLAAI